MPVGVDRQRLEAGVALQPRRSPGASAPRSAGPARSVVAADAVEAPRRRPRRGPRRRRPAPRRRRRTRRAARRRSPAAGRCRSSATPVSRPSASRSSSPRRPGAAVGDDGEAAAVRREREAGEAAEVGAVLAPGDLRRRASCRGLAAPAAQAARASASAGRAAPHRAVQHLGALRRQVGEPQRRLRRRLRARSGRAAPAPRSPTRRRRRSRRRAGSGRGRRSRGRAGSSAGRGNGRGGSTRAGSCAASRRRRGRRVRQSASLTGAVTKMRSTRRSRAAASSSAACDGVQLRVEAALVAGAHDRSPPSRSRSERLRSSRVAGVYQMSMSSPVWWLAWPFTGPPRGWLMSPT